MPGYWLSSLEKERISSKYICNFCGLLLKDAMQSTCGHFYCSPCLASLSKNGSTKMTCLQDQTEFLPNEVFPDNFMRREVQAFVVHCSFKDDGCNWEGEVRQVESHMSSCKFLIIPGVHLERGAQVKKADLTEHPEKNCKCRLEMCGYCKRQINLNKMKHHQETECPAYPVVCKKCNQNGISRGKLLQHQYPVMSGCHGVQRPRPFSQMRYSKTEVRLDDGDHGNENKNYDNNDGHNKDDDDGGGDDDDEGDRHRRRRHDYGINYDDHDNDHDNDHDDDDDNCNDDDDDDGDDDGEDYNNSVDDDNNDDDANDADNKNDDYDDEDDDENDEDDDYDGCDKIHQFDSDDDDDDNDDTEDNDAGDDDGDDDDENDEHENEDINLNNEFNNEDGDEFQVLDYGQDPDLNLNPNQLRGLQINPEQVPGAGPAQPLADQEPDHPQGQDQLHQRQMIEDFLSETVRISYEL